MGYSLYSEGCERRNHCIEDIHRINQFVLLSSFCTRPEKLSQAKKLLILNRCVLGGPRELVTSELDVLKSKNSVEYKKS